MRSHIQSRPVLYVPSRSYLKIFLKEFTDYAKAHDVIILGDGDLSYVNELLYEMRAAI